MREGTQGDAAESSGEVWQSLERMVRGKVQEFIQEILEDEVTRFLGGRERSQRRESVEGAPRGYRNGYGKPRKLTLASGTIEVRRPRVRDVEERFDSRVLPLFARRTREAGELVLQLYLHGLAEGDFELALRGLLGEGAPLSKSTVRRLRRRSVAEHAEWEGRSLSDRRVVYAWADGIYVKAGLEKDKAALLVVIGAMADGSKEILAVVPGYRESAESWAAVLRDLRARGLGVAPPRPPLACCHGREDQLSCSHWKTSPGGASPITITHLLARARIGISSLGPPHAEPTSSASVSEESGPVAEPKVPPRAG